MRKSGFILLLGIISCKAPVQVGRQNLSYLYQPEQIALHLNASLYHDQEDSSLLFFAIDPEDLLYIADTGGIMLAKWRLKFSWFPSYFSKIPTDSGSKSYVFDGRQKSSGNLRFYCPAGSKGIVELQMTDLQRNITQFQYITLLKRRDARQSFLLTDLEGNALNRTYVSSDEPFRLPRKENLGQVMTVGYYNRAFPIAMPPFREGPYPVFNYHADSTFTLPTGNDHVLLLQEEGFYHFQSDTSSRDGFTVFRFHDDFPNVTSPIQLLEPLRYLTTRQEYDRMLNATDRKAALDNWWIRCGDHPDRARELIRIFYGRVREANRLFTSYLEGWKSDRGMIYIVFGPPDQIFRDDKEERWAYNSGQLLTEMEFTFQYAGNPFTDNDLYLVRYPWYDNTWYVAVDSWRNGRPVKE